jgi:hypothetical protein
MVVLQQLAGMAVRVQDEIAGSPHVHNAFS